MSFLQARRTPLIVLTASLVVVLISSWAFYTSDGATKAREREARLEEAVAGGPSELGPSLEVNVLVARRTAAAEIVELAGVLEPIRATWVAAEISGQIIDIPAEEHAPIKKGDVLVKIDAALPRAELIRAEANHALARSELERQKRLGSRSVASEAELDQAKAEERRSFAALLEARTRVGQTRITAPFDGLVNSLDFDPGAYVQPGALIAEILDLSEIEVTVLVGDRQVNVLRPGAAARVRIGALGSERFEGRVVRVAGAPRDGGQRYPVVISLDNQAQRLHPGMLAQVELAVGAEPAIRLPARAALHEFELDYVFVLHEDDSAHRVRVETRPVSFRPDQIEITGGIEEGDRIVVSGVEELRNGLRVIVR